MGLESGSKDFWNLPLQTINFGFGSTTLSFCFNLAYVGAFFALLGPFRAIFGVWGQVKNAITFIRGGIDLLVITILQMKFFLMCTVMVEEEVI